MTTRSALGLAVFGVLIGGAAAGDAEPAGKEDKAAFGLTNVHKLHLEFSAPEWEAMQQTRGLGGPGFPGEPERPGGNEQPGARDAHRGGRIEFPWARVNLTVDGELRTNAGVRYKGNATYMASMRQLKRSLKIELDHYDEQAPRCWGLKKFNLHAGVMDSSKVHEALAYAVFRAAGVAAPRTAFAEVTLSVPGKYQRDYAGLFTLTEQVDKQFLKDRFGTDKGLLMKPQARGPDYLGEGWDSYAGRYAPHRDPTPAEARRVIEFAKLVNTAPAEQFRGQIHSFLDVNGFLRFLAVNALLVNLDSPLAMPQNFYLYLHPQTGKFVFFPWDLDLALAAWPMGGSLEQQLDLSLMHPHVGEHKLIDRLLAIPEIKAEYEGVLKELAATCFAKGPLLAQIDLIEQATSEPLAREAKAATARQEGGGGFGMPAPPPRMFVERRTESVQAQLAGKRGGYVPVVAFGPPGGPGGPGRLFAHLICERADSDHNGAVTLEEWLAAAQAFFKQCDRENKGSITEGAIAESLTRILPGPPGMGPPGGPGGPRDPGPPGRGPAQDMPPR